MSTNQLNQQDNKENGVFQQAINSYMLPDDNTHQIVPPLIEEDVITDEFLTKSGINSEQLNLNMALCREFEGE